MRHDLRWLVITMGNIAFLFIVAQANHYLAALDAGFLRGPVHLFLLGLPVTFAALRLRLSQGLAVALLTALAYEAALPVTPGLFVITCGACLCITVAVRGNFNRFEPTSALVATLVVNFALIAAVSLYVRPSGGTVAGLRIAVDLVASQLVAGALTGWFFAWQLALLRLFGFNLETELREPA
jgi:hypothetical protein